MGHLVTLSKIVHCFRRRKVNLQTIHFFRLCYDFHDVIKFCYKKYNERKVIKITIQKVFDLHL